MSNDEQGVLTGEVADGTARTFPIQVSALRKNGYAVLEGRPCKISDISRSGDDVRIVGIDMFTDRKYEAVAPAAESVDVPHVQRRDFTLVDIDEGFLSLMEASGGMKDDLALPTGTDRLDMLSQQIRADFDAGKELIVTVLSAMGEEQVVASQVSNSAM
ncbi:translation initiation factor IF-5A [Streptacidiphilus sp. P02-A3a]|uniref:translation initiation factor IF-5A n=1 Tax=Streptacidiphilus sp. P02-A3a TaxID=2704468 RepID=UPI0015FD8DE7|nr:translation initiation factor IF-5A [Streptacidiphilus sp. P02-A3a]QMU67240.1 translation initiation factor IF-5A [Streptacidiphilus sp. P02-A3a]